MSGMRERGGAPRVGADTGLRLGVTKEAITKGQYGEVAPLIGPDPENLSQSTTRVRVFALLGNYEEEIRVLYAWQFNAWCIVGQECDL